MVLQDPQPARRPVAGAAAFLWEALGSFPSLQVDESIKGMVENPTYSVADPEGIIGTLTQGIAGLIKLPSQLATKYFHTGDQHAEVTDENFSNVSHTFAAKEMEPTSGVQIYRVGKKTNCYSSLHPDLDMISDSHRVKTYLRHDQTYSVKRNSKKNHNTHQEDLQPWSLVSRRYWLEGSTIDTGRYIRKPHCTVEEAIQKEEREKYKQLLEQEKEKRSKNSSCPIIAKHLDTQRSLTETNGTSFETSRNGVGSTGSLRSKTEINSLMTVTERYSKSEKSVIQKTETVKQPLAIDLAEEVSLKLSLSQERGSCRKCFPGESEEQKCQRVDKATEGLPALTEDMEREIANVLSHGEDDEILTSAFKLNVTRGDIQTLKNQQWLNDVVINFYMNLLVERNKRPGFPNLYAFSTFFYPKLNLAGYNAVRRWTKEVDIFQYDMILVPIHIRVHWALVVIDMRRETITYFDSMGQNGYRVCMQLL
ncbi:hypothetical protein JRQ81_018027 [Phrynocephalus forsythii]|uniref:Ubiquitin-like protease family profile domain-containing protein n=1 Tax=Phrynocephalus forsythii TaxID=171643 RepID=A0A9Q0XSH4_9SAUR|nr:hypothetical protein JRQ81_018027 [Phrynocephalus forsythii]